MNNNYLILLQSMEKNFPHLTQMVKIYTQFQTKRGQKPHPSALHPPDLHKP